MTASYTAHKHDNEMRLRMEQIEENSAALTQS